MKFLGVFLATTMALAVLYAAIARFVDPRGEFGSGRFPVVESDARAEKMRLFRAYAAEAAPTGLILGSSRAMKVDPQTLERATGERFFNFAVDNARAEDYLAIYRWVRQQRVRPTRLVVGLDVEALHDDDRAEASLLHDPALMATLGSVGPAERGLLAPFRGSLVVRLAKQYKATFTIEYLTDIVTAVRLALFPGSRPVPLMEFEPDGYLRYRRWEQERAAGRFHFDRGLERCLTKSVGRFEAMTTLSARRRAYVQELADEARAEGAHLVVWITTLHPLTAQYLEGHTSYAALLDGTREYLRSLSREGVTGFDFSRPQAYDGTESGFYDCLHIDETNADRVMAALGPSSSLMVFNSTVFLFAFLPVVFTLFWVSRTKQQRYLVLTVSGYVFYGYWDWRFCFLLLFSSLVSFTAGIMIDRVTTPGARRAWMVASVAVDLSVLGFFKYYDFVAANLSRVLPGAPLPLLHAVLPIGIGFYTFHTISYIVDVARGRVRATHNLFEYLAYVSLFSQLVAGPIVRYREIEDDLERIDGPPREDHLARGIGFFVVGLVKKVIIADSIAGWIDPLLAVPATMSTAGAWMTALGYALQLYYDFSGYSDMAVGLGLMFGLRIPRNFNAPYRALGISDFWHRWHISLSSWLRDYLYVPLGGNRKGEARTYANLLVTMLLGGLWHGANWTFVVWGAYHGTLLALGKLLRPLLTPLPELVKRAGTFLLVVLGFVVFRSTDLGMASAWLAKLIGIGAGSGDLPAALVAWVAAGLVLVNLAPETWDIPFGTRLRWAPAYATAFLIAYLFVNQQASVFLYYQF